MTDAQCNKANFSFLHYFFQVPRVTVGYTRGIDLPQRMILPTLINAIKLFFLSTYFFQVQGPQWASKEGITFSPCMIPFLQVPMATIGCKRRHCPPPAHDPQNLDECNQANFSFPPYFFRSKGHNGLQRRHYLPPVHDPPNLDECRIYIKLVKTLF